MQKQDYTSKIDLSVAKGLSPTDGVGALSDLRGEISMIDGSYIISYGGGCNSCLPAHEEKAALLGIGHVKEWHKPIHLSKALSGKALDTYIIEQAKMKGIDTDNAFPIRLMGKLIDVEMHVIEGPNDGFTGHGSKVHMAKQDDYKHVQIDGFVVGFYVPKTMFGQLTHPGEHFHYHWIDNARTRTAHLDLFGMSNGSILLLPKL